MSHSEKKDSANVTPPTKAPSISLVKGTLFGAVGGLIGGLVIAPIGYAIPVPGMMGDPFFINPPDMWKMSDKVAVGWSLLVVISLVIGVIFGLLTVKLDTFKIRSVPKGLVLGAITGVVVFILVFLPGEIPEMPGLASNTTFLLESFGYNLIFGLILGAVVAGLSIMTMRKKPSKQTA